MALFIPSFCFIIKPETDSRAPIGEKRARERARKRLFAPSTPVNVKSAS